MKNKGSVLTVLTLVLVLVLAVSFTIYVSSLGRSINQLMHQNNQPTDTININGSNIKIIDNTHSLDAKTVNILAQNTALFLYSLETQDFNSVKDVISASLYEQLKSRTWFIGGKIQSILQITIAQSDDKVMAFGQVVLIDDENSTLKIEPEIEFIKDENGYLIDKIVY